MAEHTPGPWQVNAGCDWVIESQDGVSVSSVYTPAGQREVRQANARFIAAAPEMLEELESMLSEHCGNHECDDVVHDLARTALAKAKGE